MKNVIQYVVYAVLFVVVGLSVAVWAVHTPTLYWSTEGLTVLQTIYPQTIYVQEETFHVIAWVYGLFGWLVAHCKWLLETNRI